VTVEERVGWLSRRAAALVRMRSARAHGVRRRFDPQRLGQARPAGGVDLPSSRRIPLHQVRAHQTPIGFLRKRIERQPAREGDHGLLLLPAFLLPGGEPIAEQQQAHLPLLLLLLDPLVKRSVLAQPEAVQERPTHQGERVLHLGDQGGALILSGWCGEPLGLVPGALHHVQVQVAGSPRVQAEQLTLTEQMAVLGWRSGRHGEQVTQQGKGVAQGLTSDLGLTVRPQERGQFAARLHAPLDRQVEQQGLRLAQGKGEAASIMYHFRRSQHG
jgi:hypothetical protein